jgi:putative ABC transport system substrate-binding protein
MRKKIFLFFLTTLVLAAVHLAEAQQPKKIPRIGVLLGWSPKSAAAVSFVESFRQGLRELGYLDNQNIAIEYRYADGVNERLPGLAAELVHLKVDVIVTSGPGVAAAKNATKTVPIVMTNISDPVRIGLIASLARPGGNITGLASLPPGLEGKRLELLKETFPRLSRVAILRDPASATNALSLEEATAAAGILGLTIQSQEIRSPDDLEPAFSAIHAQRTGAVVILRNPLSNTYRAQILKLAVKTRLPAMYSDREFTDAGGLMSYGPNRLEQYRRAATYVDKILKGAKPVDLPVEQPIKFELIINLKTAKQIGLTIPPNVLARADKVIK